ncbi:DUF4046 domain-containing protein [Lysinibacillus sp. NPDC086135]|uniref:DUF4046 domain-containing protein n=1 Tax=Lysinibacillus sp. NPDC086135 TaxID=3364130 RepID=UPI00380E9280
MEMKSIFEIYEEVLNNELSRFPLFTWDQIDSKDTLIKLTRYLVLDKFEWDRNQFCENFCIAVIYKYRLNGGLAKLYQKNIYPYVVESFPEWEIKEWEMKKSRVPVGFWNKENAVAACKWLIEEELQWNLEKVSRDISNSTFHKNNLGGMLRTLGMNASEIIEMTYPEYDWAYLKERNGNSVTLRQVKDIKKMYEDGYSQRELSRLYKCDPVVIFNIVHEKTFRNSKR